VLTELSYTVYGSFCRFATDSTVVKKGESKAIPEAVQQQESETDTATGKGRFYDRKALVSRTQYQVSPKTR